MQNRFALRCIVGGLVLALLLPELTSADLPVAPQPRVAKTKAELLIGRWQIVQVNDQKMNDKNVLINEYCADGSFYTSRTSALRPPTAGGGTYKVVGDKIKCHKFSPQGKEVTWDIQITSITPTEAVFVQSEDNEKWVWHLKRLPNKG